MVQYLQNLRLKRFNVKLWMAIKQREIQLQTLFRMLSIIYKVFNCEQVENIVYRVFQYLSPPSTAKLGNGTYENYIFSEPYINSRLPCKFSEL